jgi:FkbM family methyltransferase
MMYWIIRLLPAGLLRYLGQLQFRVPFLRRLTLWAGARLAASEGVIQRGIGRGLRFRAVGGYPGYLLGTSEPEEQALLESFLPESGIFYDVGANIGFYSTLAAKMVGPGGHVFAFEPFPGSAASCRYNAGINGFHHVSVIEAAVSSRDASAKLELGTSTATHFLGVGDAGIEVEVICIDHWRLQSGAPGPSLVMIDVEGAEIEVLKGMRETIRECRPVIMVEVHWLGVGFIEYVQSELVPLGYRATTYAGEALPTENVRYHALLRPDDDMDARHTIAKTLTMEPQTSTLT